jgi:hypothetical protein
MRKFSNISVTPPGLFVYVDPSTGTTFKHITFTAVLAAVRNFRIANGIPLPPNWEAEVEDEMCAAYPPHIWKYVDEQPPGVRTTRIGDVLNFLKFAGSWLASGAELVSQEEATRRAAICVSCPMNSEVQGCTPCVRLVEKVSRLLGDRVTGFEGQLKGCSVCGCSNVAQVWFPLNDLQKGVTSDMQWPPHCWKKPTP